MKKNNLDVLMAEENAVMRIQTILLRLIDHHGISRAELAARLGVSTAHVSQLLDAVNPPNLSIRKIARVLQALGEDLEINTPTIRQLDREAYQQQELNRARYRGATASRWTNCSDRTMSGQPNLIRALHAA